MRLTNLVANHLQSTLREWAGLKAGLVLDVVADQEFPRVSILIGKEPADIMDLGENILRVTLDIPNITEEVDSLVNRAKVELLRDKLNPSWSMYDFAG